MGRRSLGLSVAAAQSSTGWLERSRVMLYSDDKCFLIVRQVTGV